MELLFALFDYIPTYDEIDFLDEGTKILILEEYPEAPDWVFCKIEDINEKRWFPKVYLDKNGDSHILNRIFSPDEIEVYKGEYLIKITEESGKYYVMNSQNMKGWIPGEIVKSIAVKQG